MGKGRRKNNNNTVSPNPHGDNSSSVVMSTRHEKPVHYTLKIQSFSLLKNGLASSQRQRFESQKFNAGCYEWKLALYPNGDERRNVSNHISLYLVIVGNNILSTTSEVNVVFTFLVYDTLRGKYLTVQDGKMRRFSAMKTEWGIEKLLPLDTFNDASNGFLVDDCCVFGVDIFVMSCDGGMGEVFSLIKQPKNYEYTWKLNNFSQLGSTLKESNPFTVESYRWKIWLYPSGCSKAKSGFLSMYLLFDSSNQLPQGSQVYVEYEMAILSQLEAVPVKGTYNCWFGFDGVEAGSGWGAPNFSSLSDLEEPTKGYLLNDTLVTEVKINVISTLKKIV